MQDKGDEWKGKGVRVGCVVVDKDEVGKMREDEGDRVMKNEN